MEQVIDTLIGPHQCGFIKNRQVGPCIRRTAEIIAYAGRAKRQSLVVTVDFEKCFDRVEYQAIAGSLKYFNFGDNFTRNVMMLFEDFYICTQNNGYTSPFQHKTRGVNQGCNYSPLAFILCGELMAHLILQNINIHGIKIKEIEAILAQFADDTTVFLDYDQKCLDSLCDVFSQVEQNMGLRVSYDKTTIYRIGTLVKSNAKLYTCQNFKWSDDDIDLLGVHLACDGTPVDKNFQDILVKIDSVCQAWQNRTWTLMGKVLVINSLMGSLFVYKLSTMMELSKQQCDIVENKFYQFLWKGHARIRMRTLQNPKLQGGLRLVNMQAKQEAIMIKWIINLEDDQLLQHCAYEMLSPILRNLIWRCSLKAKDIKSFFVESYWRQVLLAWSKINYFSLNTKIDVQYQIIWLNSNIKINNNIFQWKRWID